MLFCSIKKNDMSKKIESELRMVVVIVGIVALGLVDFVTGYELSFFIFYFLPISYAAWLINLRAAIGAALLSGVIWFWAEILAWHPYSSNFYAVWNTMTRLVSFFVIGVTLSRLRQLLDRERQTAEKLRQALSEIKVLETFLPICAECKKIRDKSGEWQDLEDYIGQHSNTRFSHSYCPECAKKALEEDGLTD
jgi:hypothetical protein